MASATPGCSGVPSTSTPPFARLNSPTHDDWVFRAVPPGQDRSFVKVGLERIAGVCREAAGYDANAHHGSDANGIPLGEFADALAGLMSGIDGPGARRSTPSKGRPARPSSVPGRRDSAAAFVGTWVEATSSGVKPGAGEAPDEERRSGDDLEVNRSEREKSPPPLPQARATGEPTPRITSDGRGVIRFPFEFRSNGNRVTLVGTVEVMTNDGGQMEADSPVGHTPPEIRAWIDPQGAELLSHRVTVGPDGVDGVWSVDVFIDGEAMMRIAIEPEVA